MKNPFKVGDIVKLKRGTSPMVVESVCADEISTSYVSGVHINDWRIHTDHYKQTDDNKGENTMTKETLYEVTEGENTRFATKLAVKSTGEWVMEEKGTGDTIVVDKANCEEVMEHTISIRFSNNSKEYAYKAKKGEFSAGEFHLFHSDYTDGFCIVKIQAVDTRSRQATKEFVSLGKVSVDTDAVTE